MTLRAIPRHWSPPRTHQPRVRRDERHFLPRAAALTQDRRLAARRPGAAHERGDQDPRVINEDQRDAAARGVFLPGYLFCRDH